MKPNIYFPVGSDVYFQICLGNTVVFIGISFKSFEVLFLGIVRKEAGGAPIGESILLVLDGLRRREEIQVTALPRTVQLSALNECGGISSSLTSQQVRGAFSTSVTPLRGNLFLFLSTI